MISRFISGLANAGYVVGTLAPWLSVMWLVRWFVYTGFVVADPWLPVPWMVQSLLPVLKFIGFMDAGFAVAGSMYAGSTSYRIKNPTHFR